MDSLTITLCSQNEHKRLELERVLEGWRIELLDADAYPEETGETFYENARGEGALRAGCRARRAPGCSARTPGSRSRHSTDGRASQTARWAEGRHVERALMRSTVRRSARRATSVSSSRCRPTDVELRGTGTLEGLIAHDARGSEGFGFDPVFVPAAESRTVAELGDAWKAANSHRTRAARALRAALDAAGVG